MATASSKVVNVFTNLFLTANLQVSVYSGNTFVAPARTKYMQLQHRQTQNTPEEQGSF